MLGKIARLFICLIYSGSATIAAGVSYPPGGGGGLAPHPGYVTSKWYTLSGPVITSAAGVAVVLDTARCYPGAILRKLTVSDLGVRVTTVSAGGNVQLAIYNSTASGRPGTLIGATGSLSTGTAGAVSGALSANKQLGPGGTDGGENLWFCSNSDNSTVVMVSNEVTGTPNQALIGSTNQVNVVASTSLVSGVSCARTFGTWDDLTGCVWSDIINRSSPAIIFLVNSVP